MSAKTTLHEAIVSQVIKTYTNEKAFDAPQNEISWMFDFRKILLEPEYLRLIIELFWERFENEYPFQVGGLESASIPLITGIILSGKERGKPVSGFYVRKQRKQFGLQNIIEGNLSREKIILVDDLIRNGNSFQYQIKVLEAVGKKVDSIFTIVKIHPLDRYNFITKQHIPIVSLFSPTDFGLTFDEKILNQRSGDTLKVVWQVNSPNPVFAYEFTKSSPTIDGSFVYIGSDSGTLCAFDQKSGALKWEYYVPSSKNNRGIFSKPILIKNKIYFSACDGSIHAISSKDGSLIWKKRSGSRTLSSQGYSIKFNLLFTGSESGIFKKSGLATAHNLKTGKLIWQKSFPDNVHSQPAYCEQKNIVCVGTTNGAIYALCAETGEIMWEFKADAAIKGSFAFDMKRDLVFFGSVDGVLHVLNIDTGSHNFFFTAEDSIWSTPCLDSEHIYFTSLDKHIYCVHIDTKKLIWKYETRGMIYASPVLIKDKLYIGSNDGRLYILDTKTGKEIGVYQTSERIMSSIAYNSTTRKLFVPTYANELYCLEENKTKSHQFLLK